MNYYISDMHLFYRSQVREGGINYDNRPFETLEEMHQHFLTHWNTKVTNADTVYILGDVAPQGRRNDVVALVAQLKGRKILVRGNHDDMSDYRFARLFEEIVDYLEVKDSANGENYKLVLCHYPILCWKNQHRGTILLYGHTHNSAEEAFFQECIHKMNESEALSLRREGGQDIIALNVGCMMPYMDYEPRTLQEILEGRKNDPLYWQTNLRHHNAVHTCSKDAQA